MSTKTATSPFFTACAGACGVAVLSLLWHLPPSPELVVRRGPGTALLLPLAGRDQNALRWAATALLLGAALAFFIRFARLLDYRPHLRLPRPGRVLGLLGGLGLLLAAARFSTAIFLRLQNGWWAPSELSLTQPALGFLWVFGVLLALQAAATALAGKVTGQAGWRALALWTAALLLPALALDLGGRAFLDLGKSGAAEAAGIPRQPRSEVVLFVLGEKSGKSGVERHSVPLGLPGRADLSAASVESLRAHGAKGGVFGLACLRLAAEGALMNLDVQALRASLAAAAPKDPLAWLLLVEHLSSAPRGADSAALLESLSDERTYVVGPMGAARLAAAYSGQDGAKAALWSGRASSGPGGMPIGLARPVEPGAFKPASVRGSVNGPAGVKVALFRRRDALEAPLLSPGGLAAASAVDKKGRFSFSGLPPGDYFLVVSVPGTAVSKIEGHRGVISLSAKRRSITLPLLTLR